MIRDIRLLRDNYPFQIHCDVIQCIVLVFSVKTNQYPQDGRVTVKNMKRDWVDLI